MPTQSRKAAQATTKPARKKTESSPDRVKANGRQGTSTPTAAASVMQDEAPRFKAVSALPGRIRLQVLSPVDPSKLQYYAGQVRRLDGVLDTAVIPDARSILVRCVNNGTPLPKVVDKLVAEANRLPAAPSGWVDTESKEAPAAEPPPAPVEETALVLSRGCGPDGNDSIACAVGRVVARTPARVPRIKVREYGHWSPRARHVAVSTAVVGLTLLEAPAILMVAGLALTSVPIMERTIISARRKHLTPDVYDLANIGLCAIDGTYLMGSTIAWLISVKELLRGETLRQAHIEMHQASRSTIEHVAEGHARTAHERTLDAMLDTVITDSDFQHICTKTHNTLSWPLTWLAIGAFALTRDPGYLIGIMRPRADFASSLCFGVPLPIMNAISRTAKHGPLLRNTRAIERLAGIDAIVFATVGTLKDEHLLGRHVRPLMKRGIKRFILPTETEAEHVRRTAARAGFKGVVVEPMPAARHDIVQQLVRHGHHVAVIDDGEHHPDDLKHADVHVVLAANGEAPHTAHMVMTHPDLRGLVQAIDASREAMRVLRHNTAMAAGAAVVNLGLSFVPPVAATAVNTATAAWQAMNSLGAHKAGKEAKIEDELTEAEKDPSLLDETP